MSSSSLIENQVDVEDAVKTEANGPSEAHSATNMSEQAPESVEQPDNNEAPLRCSPTSEPAADKDATSRKSKHESLPPPDSS